MTDTADEAFLKKVFKDEEKYNIVLSIREELMNRVMDECQKSYIKKQTVKFIVQCAYEAIIKYMSFAFYYHPDVPDLTHPTWIPDPPIEPSPKDTWACDAVPIRPVDYQAEEEQQITWGDLPARTSYREVSSKSLTVEDAKSCKCLEHICTCLIRADEMSKKFSKPSLNKIKFSSRTSGSSSEKQITPSSLARQVSGSRSDIVSNQLATKESTLTATSLTEECKSKVDLELCKPIYKRKKEKAQLVDAKLSIPDNLLRGSQASLVALPPIRVNSTFRDKNDAKNNKDNSSKQKKI